MVINPRFWKGRRVLLTGHTGFKGAWLSLWLREMGAELCGYSLDPPTEPNLFEVAKIGAVVSRDTRADIRDLAMLEAALRRDRPEIVFHLAAQSLVRLSYAAPIETFAVNVIGAANLLQAIRRVPTVHAAVIVTSDKCYENRGDGRAYRETDPMGGCDPYSASKGCAEIVTSSFRASAVAIGEQDSSIAIASARSGNVVGGGDWSPDRLVPDCVRAFVSGQPVKLRYPEAVRSWLHVLEPLAGYIMLAEKLLEPDSTSYTSAFNFGSDDGNDAKVLRVAQSVAQLWGEGARIEAAPGPHPPEALTLRLDATKARSLLGWNTHWDLTQTLERAVEWYRVWHRGQDVRSLMTRQLADFSASGAL
jgi:CDP-glucose 4,6-dehydratase